MAIEFNRKLGNFGAQVSGKTVDTEGKKNSEVKKDVFNNAKELDNKFLGEKTDLSQDPKAIYGAMGLSLGNTKKPDLNAQITNLVGPQVMSRVASTPAKSVEQISASADFAYDEILADDEQALFAMAGLQQPLNAPSLADMQKTLKEAPFMAAMFA